MSKTAPTYDEKNRRIIFDASMIALTVRQLAERISADYAGQPLILVGVLKGSLYFLADLSRQLSIPVRLDFIAIDAFGQDKGHSGTVRLIKDLDLDITGCPVLLIEDILRTGLTTAYLVRNLAARGPASVKVCTLLQSPDQQLIDVPVAYCGFEISRARLIGYGMDAQEADRHLPYIAEMMPTHHP